MNTQIFNLIKNDLNGHRRSQNVTFMFILTLTYVLMDNFYVESNIVMINVNSVVLSFVCLERDLKR